MAGRRLSMRRTREILRQKWALGRSHREVAQSLKVSTGAISAVVTRATAAGLSWEAIVGLGEMELEHKLYRHARDGIGARPLPSWPEIHTELRKKGVTLQLLQIDFTDLAELTVIDYQIISLFVFDVTVPVISKLNGFVTRIRDAFKLQSILKTHTSHADRAMSRVGVFCLRYCIVVNIDHVIEHADCSLNRFSHFFAINLTVFF